MPKLKLVAKLALTTNMRTICTVHCQYACVYNTQKEK